MTFRSPRHIWSFSEQLAWRRQFALRGGCQRCFHASRRILANADDKRNDAGTPHNSSDAGPARLQQQSENSEEARTAARDPPSSPPPGLDPHVVPAAGAISTEAAATPGQDQSGRMGENEDPNREGPLAQATSRVAADEDIPDTSNIARSATSTHEEVRDLDQGGTAVLESVNNTLPVNDERTPPPLSNLEAASGAENDLVSMSRVEEVEKPASNAEIATEAVTPPEANTVPATWARADQDASLQQHINDVFDTDIAAHYRDSRYLASKLVSGHPIRFRSNEEKAAVEEVATAIVKARSQRISGTKPPAYKTAPVPESVIRSMTSTMVAGQHDDFELLKNSTGKNVQNGIMRQVIMNDSYLRSDRERLLEKFQSLLPASSRTQARK